MLWEIGERGADIRTLRRRLDLDAGYLSRLLRSLEGAGLAAVERHPRDGRARTVRLTAAGLDERAVLDGLADDLAWTFLAPLNERQRTQLIDALGVVEHLLKAGLVEIGVTEPASVDARHCLNAYFRELDTRFESGFDVDRSDPPDASELTDPHGLLLIATLHDEPIGCGGLKFHPDGLAEIKRMWVDPSARGLGVGRRILSELERRARDRGVARVRLETNRTLMEAIALYRSAGYEAIARFSDEPYAHHWFEKRLDTSG